MVLNNSEKNLIFQRLCNLLDHECRLYENYIKILKQEQHSLTSHALPEIKALADKREELLTEMSACQSRRQEIMSDMGENPAARLSEAISRHFRGGTAVQLMRKLALLRKLVRSSQNQTKELNQIVGFSQRLVNGCLAIFASATNNVFRSYSPFGKIREAYHPSSGSRGTRRV